MIANSNVVKKFALGLVAAVAGLSVQAVTVSNVQVVEGTDYTSVTVSATLGEVSASVTPTYTVKTQSGNAIGSVEGTAVSEAGEVSNTIDLSQFNGFVKGQTYRYVVSAGGASAETTYFNVGWQASAYFGATAESGSDSRENGTWADTPSIDSNQYKISGTQVVFNVTSNAKIGDDTHKIVDFQCTATIDSYAFMDDVTNDVKSAIGAVTLATNDLAVSDASWMVMTAGKNWVRATATDSLKILGTYQIRMEADYGESPALLRYSIRKGTSDAWTVLTVNGAEWLASSNNTAKLSQICFAGETKVTKFDAKLSTTAEAAVGDTEYPGILDAMAAAKDDAAKTVFLFTNIKVDPTQLVAGSYKLNQNSKSFTAAAHDWTAGDKNKKTFSIEDGTMTVSSQTLVASIGSADDSAAAYPTLTEALAAGNANVFLIADVTENATSSATATLDLNGYKAQPSAATEPILKVTGGKLLIVGNEKGGSFWNAGSDAAALSAEGGTLTLDGIFVTNCTKAVYANGSSVVVSNGVYAGSFTASDASNTKIEILGGYIAAATSGFTSGKVSATGGKFTDAAASATSAIAASGYKFVAFAVSVVTNGYTFQSEVMKDLTPSGSEEVPSKVYSVTVDDGSSTIGGVQIPDAFVETVTSETEPAKQQAALNADTSYGPTGKKMKKWQCYVLGMEDVATGESSTKGPRAEGVQTSNTGAIGFQMSTPAAVKAVESGCEVKYEVEEYTTAACSGTPEATSDKVNYNETVEMTNPDGVRYYKMKVYITPKK